MHPKAILVKQEKIFWKNANQNKSKRLFSHIPRFGKIKIAYWSDHDES